MNEEHRDERDWLDAARRGLSPTAGDAVRVLAATRAALAAGAVAVEGGRSTGDAATGEGAGAAAGAGAHAAGWIKPLLAALAIAGAFGGSGYYAGYRAGRSDAARAPAQPVAAMREREPARATNITASPPPASGAPAMESESGPPTREAQPRAATTSARPARAATRAATDALAPATVSKADSTV